MTTPDGSSPLDLPDGLRFLNAGNRGPFTLDGTRTFLVGRRVVAVIDPGPDDPDHLQALARVLEDAGDVTILLTHGHRDHAGGAARLAARLDAPVVGSGLAGIRPLADGESVETDAGRLVAVPAPGHAPDHLCFHWPERRAVFAGDLLLGEGDTTWVAGYPGCVADYLAALDRIDSLDPQVIFPAHGPPLTRPSHDIARFRSHRLDRVEQVRRALHENPGATARELLGPVYGPALPEGARGAAQESIEAVLDFLRTA